MTTNTNSLVKSETKLVLVPETPESLVYDGDGNLVSDSLWTNAFNAENRLVRVESRTGVPDSMKQKLEFSYDHQGRRTTKTVLSDYSGGSYTTTNVTTFIYDGWNVVAEMSDAGTTNLYTWGLDLSGTLQGAGGIGGLLTKTDSGGGIHAYCFDGNGNVMALVDTTDGAVVAGYEYDVFGTTIRSTGAEATNNTIRFSSKIFDQETGLGYWGYRHYSPSLGRWRNRDPIGEGGFRNGYLGAHQITGMPIEPLETEINLYRFVNNAPSFLIDLLGLNLYAIDGTWASWGGGSNTERFYRNTSGTPGQARYYWNGPSLGASGLDAHGIVRGVLGVVCQDFCRARAGGTSVDINMVGWSRGGACALEVADRLNTDGCCCCGDTGRHRSGGCGTGYTRVRPVPVNFVGLFDAVRMISWPGFAGSFSPNVVNGSHARKTKSQLIFPSLNTGGRQVWFWRHDGSETSHSDIGMEPANSFAYRWLVWRAQGAGVPVTP